MKSIRHALHCDSTISVRNDPVELRCRKLLGKRCSCQVHPIQCHPCLTYTGTASEYPWNKLILGYIVPVFTLISFLIRGISNEIQACHSKSLLIYSIIVERIATRHMCHSYHGIMAVLPAHISEFKRVISRSHGDLIAVREFIIQRSSKIEILCLICCCCTHILPPYKSLQIIYIIISKP